MPETNETKIAVLQIEIAGLREQNKNHAEATQRNFSDNKEEVHALQQDVKLILEVMNKGRGAYTASLIAAGLIGSAFVSIVGWFTGMIKH